MTKPNEADPLKSTSYQPVNPDNEANLETAVNNVYEAIIEDEEHGDEDVTWLREQRHLNKSLHWFKRPSIIMISLITFLFAFGNSSGESTRQLITFKLACNYLSLNSSKGYCDPKDTQVLVSNLHMGYSISSGIIMLIASGKIGPLSDQFGRKLFIILIIGCLFLGRTLRFYIMNHFSYLKFSLMILTEILGNLCGGVLTLVTLTNCYISDIVEPHERIYSLGITFASLFVGLSIGPVVGNLILSISKRINHNDTNDKIVSAKAVDKTAEILYEEFTPLKFELAVLFVVLFFAIFILPESRSEKARRKSRTMSASSNSMVNLDTRELEPLPFKIRFLNLINFLKPLKLFISPSEIVNTSNPSNIKKERTAVIVLVVVDCLLGALAVSLGEIYVLYGIYKFNWVQSDISHLLAISCSSRAFVLIVLSPIINHKILQKVLKFKVMKKQFDMIDFSICFIGLVCETIGLILVSFAPSSLCFLLTTIITSFGTLASPSLNSAIVKFYPESKIGELFGAIALLKNLFSLVGPVTLISIYKLSLSKFNNGGAVFLVAGLIMALCTICVLSIKRLLNLNRFSEPELLTRTNSVVSFYQPIKTAANPSSSSDFGMNDIEQNKNLNNHNLSELHRKNSFIHKQRNQV